MPTLHDRVLAARTRIDDAARTAGRDPSEVRLLLATKTQDVATVLEAVLATTEIAADRGDDGAALIGENRVQELVAKAPDLADLVAAGRLEVHMIGNLQRNKINQMLPTVTGLASIDRLPLAEAVAQRCTRAGRVLDVMVQVNVSAESSKSGASPSDATALATAVSALDGLHLTGFMTIGANTSDEAEVRAGFARLREVRDEVLASGAPGTSDARELSMGMSTDLELAVAEGATTVRVGTAVFGERPAA